MANAASAVERKIVSTIPRNARTRRGIIHLATLECGHLVETNARERKLGRVHCWDCHYAKPKHPQAVITLQEVASCASC